MKHIFMSTLLIALVSLFAACERPPRDTTPGETAEPARQPAADDVQAYTYEQREAFVAAMEVRLEAVQNELEELGSQIDGSTEVARAEIEPGLRDLEAQAAELEERLDEARDADRTTWETVQARISDAYDDLADGLRNARQGFADWIEP